MSGIIALGAVLLAPAPLVVYLLARARPARAEQPALGHTVLLALVWWSIIEADIVAVLGWLGRLGRVELMMLAGAVTLWGLWLISRDGGRHAKGLLAELGRLGSAGVGQGVERAIIALLIGVSFILIVQVVSLPITDFDSLAYQLPRVVQWYQSGSFYDPLPQFVGNPLSSYPFAWSTVFFLGLASVGHDQFILIANLAAWWILGLSVYGLARAAGGARAGATFASALVMLMPVTTALVGTAHADLAFAAFLLASVYFCLDAWCRGSAFSAVTAVASAGMFLGVKMSALPHVAVLMGLCGWLIVSRRLARAPGRLLVTDISRNRIALGLAAASISLLGMSWYCHNAVTTGNPLGLIRVSVLGWTVWDGPVSMALADQTNLLSNFRFTERHDWIVVRDALVAWLSLPGLTLGLLVLSWPFMLRRGPDRLILAILGALAAVCVYLYVASPWTANDGTAAGVTPFMGQALRYALACFGILGAIAGAGVTQPSGRLPSWLMVALVLLSGVLAADPTRSYTYPSKSRAAFVVVVLAMVAARTRPGRRLWSWCRALCGWLAPRRRASIAAAITAGGVLLLLVSVGTTKALAFRHRAQDRMFGGISRFVDRDLPHAARIGFWAAHPTFLLYGKTFTRTLRYVPLGQLQTREKALSLLAGEPIEVLAVGPRNGSPLPVWDWLAAGHGRLQQVQGEAPDDDVLVYRIIRPAS